MNIAVHQLELQQQPNCFKFILKSLKNIWNELYSSGENMQFRISEAFLSVSVSSVSMDTLPCHMLMWQLVTQFNWTCYCSRRASVSHFPLQAKPWIIVISRKTGVLSWNDSSSIGFCLRLKISCIFYSAAVLHCTALDMFWFYNVADDMPGVKMNPCCNTSDSVSLLFSAN